MMDYIPLRTVVVVVLATLIGGATDVKKHQDELADTRTKDLSSKLVTGNEATRAQSQAQLIRIGPTVLDVLRPLDIREATEIVKNYEALVSDNRKDAKSAVRFFARHKGILFLAEGLLVEDRDVKVSCVRELKKFERDELKPIVPKMLQSLQSTSPHVAGSEESTLNRIYLQELTRLLAHIVELQVSEDQLIADKIAYVVENAKAWLATQQAENEKPTQED